MAKYLDGRITIEMIENDPLFKEVHVPSINPIRKFRIFRMGYVAVTYTAAKKEGEDDILVFQFGDRVCSFPIYPKHMDQLYILNEMMKIPE